VQNALLIPKELRDEDEGLVSRQIEGPSGGGAWFAEHGRIVPNQQTHYSILVKYVKDYL